jgi:uncharacterized protein
MDKSADSGRRVEFCGVATTASRLLQLHDTPRRTAAAFALGVFFSFSPFLGFQIVIAMGLAFALRLNRLAVFAGLNANLPWIIVPWYAGTTLAAGVLMGIALPPDFRRELESVFSFGLLSPEFWTGAARLLRPYLLPFLVGPTIGAAVLGLGAYPATYAVLNRQSRP